VQLQADAVLFDSDGVLVDTRELVESAWRQLASEFGLPIGNLLKELVGVRAYDTLAKYLDGDRIEAAVQRLEDLEVELTPGTTLKAGAGRLLESMPDGRWGIVTSASRRLAAARWSSARLPIPQVTVTADDVRRGKPDPEPFATAARRLGVDPGRCVVFEDSASGGRAARALGATVLAVGDQPWPFDPAARIPDLGSVSVQTEGGSLTVRISRLPQPD
jgi:sugar-phosphatase